jgi:hypothetical protein
VPLIRDYSTQKGQFQGFALLVLQKESLLFNAISNHFQLNANNRLTD